MGFAGLVLGVQGVGVVAVTVVIVKRGPPGRRGLLVAGALVLAGAVSSRLVSPPA